MFLIIIELRESVSNSNYMKSVLKRKQIKLSSVLSLEIVLNTPLKKMITYFSKDM